MSTSVNAYIGHLAQSLASGGSESVFYVDKITTLTGEVVTTAAFSIFGKGTITIDPLSTTNIEFASFTAVDGSAISFTGGVRGLSAFDYTASTSRAKYHPVGTTVIIAFGVHNLLDLVTYVQGIMAGTIGNASSTVNGITKLSVAAVSPTVPIAVGDNDPRVPTQGENDALVGNGGTVGSTNTFVTQIGNLYFGDGSDGALVYDGTTTILGMAPTSMVYTLTRDIFATNITINSGVTIIQANYRIYFTGTIYGTGTIKQDGTAGGNGGNASVGGGVSTAGTAGTGTSSISGFFTSVGGGAGGIGGVGVNNGSATSGAAGVNGTVLTNSIGSNGIAGGAGGGGNGGGGGSAGGSAGTITALYSTLTNIIKTSGKIPLFSGFSYLGLLTGQGGAGGGGGGSGGTNGGGRYGAGGGGGGSGSAGGLCFISGNIWAASLTFHCVGGAGGTGGNGSGSDPSYGGGGGGGGGSGGNGGVVLIMYKTKSGTNIYTLTGGAGGTGGGGGQGGGGGGSNGTAGTTGTSYELQLS